MRSQIATSTKVTIMNNTIIIDKIKGFCKLYKGGDQNPYNHSGLSGSEWAMEYLRFQIWDAEYSVISKFTWWSEQCNTSDLTDSEKAERIYQLAIQSKLSKMQRPDIDFVALYFRL